jgi:hypothetical protein
MLLRQPFLFLLPLIVAQLQTIQEIFEVLLLRAFDVHGRQLVDVDVALEKARMGCIK